MSASVRLVGLDVAVPLGVTTRTAVNDDCAVRYEFRGASVRELGASIERVLVDAGFSLAGRGMHSFFSRDEQRITASLLSPDVLLLSVDDPEVLPFARFGAEWISLDSLVVPLPGITVVRPLRERHSPKSRIWVGEWLVAGGAQRVSETALVSLSELGLSAVGPLVPKEPRIGDTWSSEAYSRACLVKVYARQLQDCVRLRLELIV